MASRRNLTVGDLVDCFMTCGDQGDVQNVMTVIIWMSQSLLIIWMDVLTSRIRYNNIISSVCNSDSNKSSEGESESSGDSSDDDAHSIGRSTPRRRQTSSSIELKPVCKG